MVVNITIYRKTPMKVLDNGANGLSAATIAGALNNGQPLTNDQAANLAAQTAAWGAGTLATLGSLGGNVTLSYAAAATGAAAFSSAGKLLATDLQHAINDYQAGNLTFNDKLAIVSDTLTMVGDLALIAGAFANVLPATPIQKDSLYWLKL